MWIYALERSISRVPLFGGYYQKRAAGLKKSCCLALNRFGLLKPFTFVQWLATYACNLSCPYCEASAGSAASNELTTIEAKTFIDDLFGMGVKHLFISGGEPLVRPDIIELMGYANEKRIIIGLATNGYLVEEMWDELKGLKYLLYFTSIDGPRELHDKVRGKRGSFDRALHALERFEEIGVNMRLVNTVVHPGNIGQLDDLLGIIKASSATLWHLTPTANVGRAEGVDKYSLDGDELRFVVDFIKKNRKVMAMDLGEAHKYLGCLDGAVVGKPFFCGAGLTRCSVMPNGMVIGCQQIYDDTIGEGNIREKSFSRIWKEEFKRFRAKGFHDYCNGCTYLDSCQGGCWAEMQKHDRCLKSVWEKGG